MFRRTEASQDAGRKPTQRIRSSIVTSEPDKPLIIVRDPSVPRKLSIQIRRRPRGYGEKKFWWPKCKKPTFELAGWKISTFFERHERFNAWPQKPWTTIDLEDNYYTKRFICGCIPVYKKKAHVPEPFESSTNIQYAPPSTSSQRK